MINLIRKTPEWLAYLFFTLALGMFAGAILMSYCFYTYQVHHNCYIQKERLVAI